MNNTVLPQMMITAKQILIDHSYQRRLNNSRITEMGQVDMERIGVLLLSIRNNGDAYAIDGQTRRALLISAGLGDVPVPAQYYTGLTLQEEAEAFYKANMNGKAGRLPVNAWDRFKAQRAAGHFAEVEITRVVESLGLRIANSTRRGISSVEALGIAHNSGNLKKTIETLQLWCPEGGKVYENSIIRAVSAFYSVYPKADKNHLAKALSPFSPIEVSQRIARNKIVYGSPSLAKVGVLREIYNKNLKPNSRLQ